MLRKQRWFAMSFVVLWSVVLAACSAPAQPGLPTAAGVQEAPVVQPSTQGSVEGTTGATAEAMSEATTETTTQAPNGAAAARGEEPVTAASGSAESAEGGAAGDTVAGGAEGTGTQTSLSGAAQVYTDATYGFAVTYGAGYRQMTNTDLGGYVPVPAAEVQFFPLAAIENNATSYAPATLAVRIYANPGSLSAEEWLKTMPEYAVPDANLEPVTLAGVPAVRACLPMTMAPGCAVVAAHRGAILAFIPLGAEGEALLEGVVFIP